MYHLWIVLYLSAIETVFQLVGAFASIRYPRYLPWLGTSSCSFAAPALRRLPWLLTRSGTSTAAPANYSPNEQY